MGGDWQSGLRGGGEEGADDGHKEVELFAVDEVAGVEEADDADVGAGGRFFDDGGGAAVAEGEGAFEDEGGAGGAADCFFYFADVLF